MAKFIELKIKDPRNIYQELAIALCPFKNKPVGSMLFVVEGTTKNPIIGLRYPGRKLRKEWLYRLISFFSFFGKCFQCAIGAQVSSPHTIERIGYVLSN